MKEEEKMAEPLLGIMYVVCCRCKADLPAVPVSLSDPANGMISHGMCDVCKQDFCDEMKRTEALDAAASETRGE